MKSRSMANTETWFHNAGAVGEPTASSNGVRLNSALAGSNPSVEALGDDTNVSLTITTKGTGSILTLSPLGYGGTGAGGTVTQATSKSTGVTLNTVTGEITMNAASLAADTTVAFTLTNSKIAAGDYVAIQHVSAGTQASYIVTASAAAGTATVNVHNATPAALAEAIVLKFMVFKSATA